MDAKELLLPGGKPSGVWMCGNCRVLSAVCHAPVRVGDRDTTEDEKRAHALKKAERCCEWPCGRCGARSKPHYELCDACAREDSVRRAAEREAQRFERATKLTVEEWGRSDAAAKLFDDAADKWFGDLGEAEEWYAEDEERERPAYLWCSTPVKWRPDASGYVADQLHDNFHEDACDEIPDAEYKRLDEFVDAWWEKQGVVSYEPDFSRCVLLPPVEQKVPMDELGGEG